MELYKVQIVAFAVLLLCIPLAYSWGVDGHLITCRLAQLRLSKAAAEAVSELLPSYADNDLSSLCSWADRTVWVNQAKAWESCSYASEGIKAACDWAYKGVSEGSVLEDDYFLSRYPVVDMRLAQGGVRLAATLNRIFGSLQKSTGRIC